MIYLKIILALLLSAVPFLYASFIRPRQETSPKWRNMLATIGSLGINSIPLVKALRMSCSKYLHRLYEGMKKSDNCRKFFSLLTLLVMIAVQFVDFSASTEIARGIKDVVENDPERTTETAGQMAHLIAVYGPLMSKPYATLLAACASMTLFVYGASDWLLTRLHNSSRIFFSAAMMTLVILFASPRFLVVTEMLEIILMAALVYPNRTAPSDPKGKKGLPVEKKDITFRNAA